MWCFVCLCCSRCFNKVCSMQNHCDYFLLNILLKKKKSRCNTNTIKHFNFSNKTSDGTRLFFLGIFFVLGFFCIKKIASSFIMGYNVSE